MIVEYLENMWSKCGNVLCKWVEKSVLICNVKFWWCFYVYNGFVLVCVFNRMVCGSWWFNVIFCV